MNNNRRSRMKIIVAIPEAANEEGDYGTTQTKIMYKASLSYEQLKQYLPILIDNDVLRRNDETRTLKITEKGIGFLQIYHEINNMTEEESSSVKVSSINSYDRTADRGKEKEEEPNLIKRKMSVLAKDDNKPLAKLLIVDDDSDIVEVLKRGLEAGGFLVDTFTSSKEAIDAFKPDVYDLAILDIRMPGLTGFELYREMKRVDPTITACFLSAFEIHPDEFEKMFPSLMEVKTIIKKPVSIQQLLSEIKPLLRISSIERARSGDHLAVTFDTPQELIEQSLQFLKTGLLEKDEDILLVTDELSKDAIREKIAREWKLVATDVNSLEQEGRITLRTSAEWHLIDNKFDAKRSKTMMVERTQKALDDGRNGLRFVNDANTLLSRNRRMQQIVWESSLERQFDMPITLLCAYTKDNIRQSNYSLVTVIQHYHNRMMVIGGIRETARSDEAGEP